MARIAVVTLSLCLLASSAAVARKPKPPKNKPPVEEKSPSAVRLEAGSRAYNVLEYDQAITEWKAGYAVAGEPVFLFHIAQAYRDKGEAATAIRFYESYLRDAPEGPHQAAALEAVTALKKAMEAPASVPVETELDDTPAVAPAPVVEPVVGPVAPPAPVPSPSSSPSPLVGLGVGVGVVGVALVATGAMRGLQAALLADDVEAAAARGEPWETWSDDDSAGKRASTLSLVAFGAGAVALAAGGALYLVGRRRGPAEQPRVSVMPAVGPRTGQVTLTVEF